MNVWVVTDALNEDKFMALAKSPRIYLDGMFRFGSFQSGIILVPSKQTMQLKRINATTYHIIAKVPFVSLEEVDGEGYNQHHTAGEALLVIERHPVIE